MLENHIGEAISVGKKRREGKKILKTVKNIIIKSNFLAAVCGTGTERNFRPLGKTCANFRSSRRSLAVCPLEKKCFQCRFSFFFFFCFIQPHKRYERRLTESQSYSRSGISLFDE